MTGLMLGSLWARRRRVVSICVAVALGVAFLTGTLVLGDTLNRNFDRLFTDASAGTDVVVRNATAVDPSSAPDTNRGLIDESLLARVRAVPGVEDAEAQIVGYGSLLGRDGDAIGGNGPPREAGSWIGTTALNPYRLVEGRAPETADEVVINRGAAKSGDLHVGDTTTVQTSDPVTVKIVGIATFGTADGLGMTTWTAFTLAGAQDHIGHAPGKVSTILVKAAPGVSSDVLRARIAAQLPSGVQAITGAQLTRARINDIARTFLDMLRAFMTVFAVIALIVAALTIYNTFSIVVAQRTGELALLRAVGASRRQLRRLASLEAALVGGVGAVIGAAGGLGIAAVLKGVFNAFGGALPAGGLEVRPLSLIVGIVVGVVVTLIAAQVPGRRAAAIPPVAALCAMDVEAGALLSRRRLLIGSCLLAVGVVTATAVAVGGGVVALAALSGLLVVVGALLLAPAALPPAATVVGGALRRIRGVSGRFAQENAQRNPRRSAATATALVVGVAVVALITVLVASLKTTLATNVRDPFTADLAVNTSSFGGSQLSPRAVTDLQALPQVDYAVGLGQGPALIGSTTTTVTNTDVRSIALVVGVRTLRGSLSDVGAEGMAVSSTKASDRGWTLGTIVPLTFSDGNTERVTIGAIYDDNSLLGDVVIPSVLWNQHTAQPTERSVFITTRAGVTSAEARRVIDPIAKRFGGDVQDSAEYADAAAGGLNFLLGLVYVLLLLAIVIALLGITNTLSLAVYERRREIGLMRAVGQTRRQARSVLRLESAIIATFGTLMGVVVGTFIGWSLFEAIAERNATFSVPVTQLVVIVLIGAFAGVLAGWRPARRAARVPILDAIAAQ
jgi:putative ABC transport system permease protein